MPSRHPCPRVQIPVALRALLAPITLFPGASSSITFTAGLIESNLQTPAPCPVNSPLPFPLHLHTSLSVMLTVCSL